MTDHYAVIGNPVEHSKSPRIHALFAQQTAQDLDYTKLWAPREHFDAVAGAFFTGGGKGMNVTVPFKEDAHRFADRLTDRADRASAVNTLRAEPDGTLLGDNTDGAGLVRDLRDNLEVKLAGTRILILGAGGAVHGILPALLDEKPVHIVVANRTAEKAYRLAEPLPDVDGAGLDAIPSGPFDVIINGTSSSLSDASLALPEGLVAATTACYDLVYADHPTPFMEWAAAQSAETVRDGLGMLVEQAAESFFLWRGVHPETAPVIRALRPE